MSWPCNMYERGGTSLGTARCKLICETHLRLVSAESRVSSRITLAKKVPKMLCFFRVCYEQFWQERKMGWQLSGFYLIQTCFPEQRPLNLSGDCTVQCHSSGLHWCVFRCKSRTLVTGKCCTADVHGLERTKRFCSAP